MRNIVILSLVVAALFTGSASAIAATAKEKPWYEKPVKPTTLKAAFAEDLKFLGPANYGYRMPGSSKLCEILTSVRIACDYNHRVALSQFLTVWGKPLFPAEGGTNPYFPQPVASDLVDGYPDDYYIGTARQNAMLAAACLSCSPCL